MYNNTTINPWYESGRDYSTADLLKMSSTPSSYDEYGLMRPRERHMQVQRASMPPPPPDWGEKDAKCPAALEKQDDNMYKILFFILLIGIIILGLSYLMCSSMINSLVQSINMRSSPAPVRP